ncbi:MAG TPA: 50S ribosomal protein L29 [Candidatus Nanoarchaeia archaeon]|nr:50S ribosomal protein L29 [Candidatus Nanoarchaeia archaeon]
MAKIKKRDLKSMPLQEMASKLKDLQKELMKLNAKRAMGVTPESPGRIKMIKKTIARIHTFQKQSEGGMSQKQ